MKYRFAEIVDVPALQAMMESLWRASGIPTGIVETDGKVLVATGWQTICTVFHRRHPVTAARCAESDASIAAHLRDGSLPECGYVEYRCKNGMVDIALPIVVDGHHLATLFLGQFFYEPPDETFFRRQAKEHGFDTDAYLEALREVPVFSVDKVRNILAFNARLVDMVSGMGVEKLRQLEGFEALRRSEEKFKTLFESSNDGICIVDAEGRILEVNQLACAKLKRTRSELLSANMRQLLTADRSANFDNRIAEIKEKGGLIFESELLLPEGNRFPTEISIRPITLERRAAFLGTFRDISERRRAQQALRESEERFRSIFNAAATSMGIISPDGRVLQVNPAACRLFGYSEEEFVGLTVDEITHPEDRDRSGAAYRAMVSGEQSADAWEKRYLRRDGIIVWGHTTLAPVRDFGGAVAYFVALTQDVTAQKRSEAVLRENDRMKSEFIRTAAHEFRTPLTTIQGFSQVLLERDDLTAEERREFLDYIHQRSLALGQIVAALLDVSRIEAGQALGMEKAPCTVGGLVSAVAPSLRHEAGGHRLEIVLADDGTLLEADRERVGQVLENLVSNAVKYSPPDATVTVRGEGGADGYRFAVIDRGRGLTPEEAERVFDSFYRADASDTAVGGVGLGLSVARQIVEGHGGRLEVDSEIDRGTTVSFVLPFAGEEGGSEKAADR